LWNTNEDPKLSGGSELKKIVIGSALDLENKENVRSFKDQKYFLRPHFGMLYGMAASALVAPSFTAILKVSDEGISFGVPAVFDVVMDHNAKVPTIYTILGMAKSTAHYMELIKKSIQQHSKWHNIWRFSAAAFLLWGFYRSIDRIVSDKKKNKVSLLNISGLACCVLAVTYAVL